MWLESSHGSALPLKYRWGWVLFEDTVSVPGNGDKQCEPPHLFATRVKDQFRDTVAT